MLLRTIYCDKNSTFDKSLDEVGSVTMHEQSLQFLEIEMFKVAKNSAPTIFYEIFKKNEQNICYLRNTNRNTSCWSLKPKLKIAIKRVFLAEFVKSTSAVLDMSKF